MKQNKCQHIDESSMRSITIPITLDNLPEGMWFDDKGACWEAIKCNVVTEGCDWRWARRNLEAFKYDKPQGEMTDYVRPKMPSRV